MLHKQVENLIDYHLQLLTFILQISKPKLRVVINLVKVKEVVKALKIQSFSIPIITYSW